VSFNEESKSYYKSALFPLTPFGIKADHYPFILGKLEALYVYGCEVLFCFEDALAINEAFSKRKCACDLV